MAFSLLVQYCFLFLIWQEGVWSPSDDMKVAVNSSPDYILIIYSLSCVQLFAAPWTVAYQAPLSPTIQKSLLRLMSIESVRPSNHVILCCPLLFCLQSFPASGFFPMGWLCIWWPKYWRFSFSNSPSIEYSRLISFRIDWFVAVVQSFSHVSL